jgi:hypothetical protein
MLLSTINTLHRAAKGYIFLPFINHIPWTCIQLGTTYFFIVLAYRASKQTISDLLVLVRLFSMDKNWKMPRTLSWLWKHSLPASLRKVTALWIGLAWAIHSFIAATSILWCSSLSQSSHASALPPDLSHIDRQLREGLRSVQWFRECITVCRDVLNMADFLNLVNVCWPCHGSSG